MKHLDWEGALLDLQKRVHDFRPKLVADQLGISVNSLYKQIDPHYNIEINPQDTENPDGYPRYKLGFKTFFKICLIIDDFTAVFILLNAAGYATFKLVNESCDNQVLKALSKAMNESNDVAQVTMKNLEDNKIDVDEAEKGILECDQAINAWARLKNMYQSVLIKAGFKNKGAAS